MIRKLCRKNYGTASGPRSLRNNLYSELVFVTTFNTHMCRKNFNKAPVI